MMNNKEWYELKITAVFAQYLVVTFAKTPVAMLRNETVNICYRAVAAERERAAKIAMSYDPSCADDDMGQTTAIFIAKAIRKDRT